LKTFNAVLYNGIGRKKLIFVHMEKALNGEKSTEIEHNLVKNRKTREKVLCFSFYLQ
jgi:hypothetical protein